jgi:acyl-CoA synthetase (AMP-forming)/AMP-acid ligase II
MNRWAKSDRTSSDKGLVDIFLQYTSGATGAIPATLTHANFIKSVVRDGAGDITITLQDGYVGWAEIDGSVVQASFDVTTGWQIVPDVVDVGGTIPTIGLLIVGQDGTSGIFSAKDTADGDIVSVHICLRKL